MKEWISDKKNQPIIIGIASVIIVAGIVFLLFQLGVIGGGGSSNVALAPPPGGPTGAPVAPGVPGGPGVMAAPGGPVGAHGPMPGPPGAPGAPGGPGASAAAGAAGAASAAAAKPVKVARVGKADPFMPAVNAKRLIAPPPAVNLLIPIQRFASVPALPGPGAVAVGAAPTQVTAATAPDVQLGRIAGLLFGNGVAAIYVSQGNSTIVHPGEELPDGQGRVGSITPSGVTVIISGNRTINLPETSGEDNGGANGQQPAGA